MCGYAVDVLRSCYSGKWNLPGVGEVEGYYYFRPDGTPFYEDWNFFGSRNWHKGDGTPWPEFGELEHTKQKWRNGWLPLSPPDARRIGDAPCIAGDLVHVGTVDLVHGIDRRCWAGELSYLLPGQGGVDVGGEVAFLQNHPLVPQGGVDVGGAAAITWEETDLIIGEIRAFAFATLPSGFLPCDGAAVSRTTYAALFAKIGTTWGVGDGSTTFNVPDLRGRSMLGSGTGAGLTARSLAQSGGAETHQLVTAEIPSHIHGFTGSPGPGPGTAPGAAVVAAVPAPGQATLAAGGDGSHNNMEPWVCAVFGICYAD